MRRELLDITEAGASACARVRAFLREAARGFLLIGALALAGCASDELGDEFAVDEPETGIEYTPVLTGAPSEEIQALMEESLLVFRRQEQGAQSTAFLRRRAEADIPTAQKILRSYGYYGATVTTQVTSVGGGGEGGSAEGAEAAAQPAIAEIAIEAGDAFILARHDITFTDFDPSPPPDPVEAGAFGSPVGQAAAAAPILASEAAIAADLKRKGRPYAKTEGRRALADRDEKTLEIDSTISAGPAYVFGPITFEGAPNVDDEYLLTYLPWVEGKPINTALLASFQRRLMSTQLFRSGRVELPETPPDGEAAPVKVTLDEAPFRTVRAGLRYDTDEGPGVRFGFEHRNLAGRNETLSITADAALDEQVLETEFRKPQFQRPRQDLTAGLELRRIDDDAFDELGGTLTLGIERRLGRRWTVGAGGLIEYSSITDLGTTNDAVLGGLPFFAAYDGSDDLLDPTTGERFRIDITPFGGSFAGSSVTFLVLDATGSIYRPLDSEGDVVVAARSRLGSILSDGLSDVPQTRRLYSGGGGSVRGFAEDLVGPLDSRNDPIGGRSVMEVGGEIRGKVWGDLALAAFIEGGAVSLDPVPSFEDEFLVAAGGGVRYHSPIGPIRLDIGFPLNGRSADDNFQFYISIGQAF